jgi:pimeloyl-ACP methyl ester carboxylesterase
MAKVGGAYTAPKLKKPLPTQPPLAEFDPKYLERKAELGEKKFALKSGRWFTYFTEGNPEDPAVLCLHGASMSKWDFVMPETLPGVFLIVPDRMGHGGSTPYMRPPDLSQDVPEYLELLDDLKVDKFYVMGHSWGALTAIQIAAAYPTRVLACASLSAPCFPYGPGITKEETKTCDSSPGWFVGLNKSGCYPAFGRFMVRKIFGAMAVTDKTKDFGMADRYKMMFGPDQPECGDKRMWDRVAKDHFFVTRFFDALMNGSNKPCSAYYQFRSNWRLEGSYFDLSKIQCPTFIYNGKNETTHMMNAEIYKRSISGSELIVLEEHGHASIGMEAGKVILALVQKKAMPPNY